MYLLTLRSLFAARLHSTVAGPPVRGPVPEPSVEQGRGETKVLITSYADIKLKLKQNGNELTASVMMIVSLVMMTVSLVMMTVSLVTSVADLAKMSVTMARLTVVCSCTSQAVPLTAPLTSVITSS